MVLLLLSLAQAAPPPLPCGTLERLQAGGLVNRSLPAPPPAAEKALRDAYGMSGNERTSENFVVRWGSLGGVTEAEVDRLLTAFEAAWAEEIGVQGHPLPLGADAWRFNVYIGDSGGGAPSGYGSAGYFYNDDEGQPMVVVAASTLDDPDYADITAAHEFYHAIQGGVNRYSYEGDSAWYWEATATWASATVYPDNLYYASFLFAFALLPHRPVNFFDYPDSGKLQEYFQYGAFLFPFDLTELQADRLLIQETWTDDGRVDDPLAVLADKLASRGIDLNEAWLDAMARLTVLDYPEGRAYSRLVDGYADYYDEEAAASLLGPVGPEGSGGVVEAPDDTRPYRYGHNVLKLRPEGVALTVTIEGDPVGDAGSPATWGGRVIVDDGGAYFYSPLVFEGTTATFTTEGLVGDETYWVVVGPWTESSRKFDEEQFAWRYTVTAPETEDTGDPVDTAGEETPAPVADSGGDEGKAACGCASTGAPLSSGALALALLASRRRRRS
jgi:hypothetical protein